MVSIRRDNFGLGGKLTSLRGVASVKVVTAGVAGELVLASIVRVEDEGWTISHGHANESESGNKELHFGQENFGLFGKVERLLYEWR